MQPPHQRAEADICIDATHFAFGALFDAFF